MTQTPFKLTAKTLVFALAAVSLPVFATSSSQPLPVNELIERAPEIAPEGDTKAFAFDAIREIGLAYGIRAGLAWGSRDIAQALDVHAERLDRVFAFQPLMMPGNVVPPVLTHTTQTYDERSTEHVVLADAVYRIERPARFSSTPPNWRDYLLRTPGFNSTDIGGWVPRNSAERQHWERAVKEGWSQGIDQSQEIFEANLSRLTRDLAGMILYRQLYARNMVTEPIVSRSDLGVTGGGNEMNVNEVILHIRERSALQSNPAQWKVRRN